MQFLKVNVFGAAAVLGFVASAMGTTVPFTEEFATDASNWRDAGGGALLSFNASGGPDGSSFASGTFNFVGSAEGDTPVLLRGQDGFNSSGDAFVGDWLTDGVETFSAYVKHDAPAALNFFTRFASSANFPGAVAIDFGPVLPNTWTEISFAISPASAQFVTFEGSDFNTVFSNIGNVQIGVSVPATLAGTDASYTFSLDKPTVVPEPATLGLLTLAGGVAWRRRGRGRVVC
jgi:hypothetical protein